MGSSLRIGAAVGLLTGALAGFLVCLLEWPFPNYTLLGNEVLVDAARRLVSSAFGRAIDTPLRLFGVYLLAGGAAGALSGVAVGAAVRILGRHPDARGLVRLHGTLLGGGALTAYLVLGIVHFRLPTATVAGLAAVAAVAAFPIALLLSALASRAVPVRPARVGSIVLGVVVVVLVAEVWATTAAMRSRGRNVIDIPISGSNGSKVAMFCLDGTAWDLLRPLMKAGKLPNISRLVENGSWGHLRSTLPPIKSPQVWTSIATSRQAKDHEVFDFLSYAPATGQWVPTTNRIRRVRTFWDVLADLGVSVDLLSWYPSWPPDSIPGVMLTDRATLLDGLPQRVFPADREPLLDSLVTAARAELPVVRRRFTSYDPAADVAEEGDLARAALRKSGIAILDQTYVRDQVTLGFAKDCLRRGQPECFVAYFRGIDSMQHKFRKFHGAVHDPLLAGLLYDVTEEEAEQLGGIIDRYAEYLDECLGEIIAMLEAGTTILVVSDHGHSYRNDAQINVRPNALLVPLGWTQLRGRDIDFSSSRFYGRQDPTRTEVLRVYANVEGRGDAAVIAREDMTEAVNEARAQLAGLKTRLGVPLFRQVEMDADAGTPDSEGDLRCEVNPEALGGTLVVGGGDLAVTEFAYRAPKSGNHRITGVILLSGGDAARGRRIRSADVFDVTPTLFRLLDIPLSLEWEGGPIEEALAPSFRDLSSVRWVRSYETDDRADSWEDAVTEGADEAVLEELRALGYIQ